VPETISHSGDMVGADQNLNGSHDITMPFWGWFAILRLALATVNLLTKFEVSNSTHYKGDTKCRKVIQSVENGVVWGS